MHMHWLLPRLTLRLSVRPTVLRLQKLYRLHRLKQRRCLGQAEAHQYEIDAVEAHRDRGR